MRVADLMQKDVRTIAPEASLAELVQAMADSRVSGLPVVTPAGRVVGVVSATDVLQASAEPEDARARATLFEHTMGARPHDAGPVRHPAGCGRARGREAHALC
ncbi:MAG: hypothetical protein K0S86_257 [Geminicoccaceae bacterium]|jgi:CBS domain-containing protein|nr:hypothetical protein [Geminicoccaceae bacterium]